MSSMRHRLFRFPSFNFQHPVTGYFCNRYCSRESSNFFKLTSAPHQRRHRVRVTVLYASTCHVAYQVLAIALNSELEPDHPELKLPALNFHVLPSWAKWDGDGDGLAPDEQAHSSRSCTSSLEPHSVACQVFVLLKSIFGLQGGGARSAPARSGYGRKRDREKGRASCNLTYMYYEVCLLDRLLRRCKRGSDYTDITPRSGR